VLPSELPQVGIRRAAQRRKRLNASADEATRDGDVTGAIEVIWDLVRSLNKHVEETKPWELAKDEAHSAELDRVLYDLADGLRVAAVALSAYLPRTAPLILQALRQSEDLAWKNVEPGHTVPVDGIEPAAPLFPRVDHAPLAAA